MTGTCHHIQLLSIEMGFQTFFLPELAWNYDPTDFNMIFLNYKIIERGLLGM
jgi:hypothetical protein